VLVPVRARPTAATAAAGGRPGFSSGLRLQDQGAVLRSGSARQGRHEVTYTYINWFVKILKADIKCCSGS
jgi:hypothetical protein